MPYELEYKKVHNTLSNKGLNDVYGYETGNIINPFQISDDNKTFIFLLKEERQQIVIQNNTNRSLNIKFFSTEGVLINSLITLSFGESRVVDIPNNALIYNNGEVQPTQISMKCYEVTDNTFENPITSPEILLWTTKNNIVGYAEDNTIMATEVEENVFKINFQSLKHSEIAIFLSTISVTKSNYNITITYPQDPVGVLPEDYMWVKMQNSGIKIVLVPLRKSKRKQIGILKSITNMRNSHQISIYDTQYKKISLYLEPIIVPYPTLGDSSSYTQVMSFDDPTINTPLPATEYFTPTQNRQRCFMTYGLKTAKWKKALFVCRACGYDDGSNAGATTIGFGIGAQTIKAVAPHSGCSLLALKRQDIEYSLTRLAAARKDNNNCVIDLSE